MVTVMNLTIVRGVATGPEVQFRRLSDYHPLCSGWQPCVRQHHYICHDCDSFATHF
jgi:hypothetical protein